MFEKYHMTFKKFHFILLFFLFVSIGVSEVYVSISLIERQDRELEGIFTCKSQSNIPTNPFYYSTIIGGDYRDRIVDIVEDTNGEIYALCRTNSDDFLGAKKISNNSDYDCVIIQGDMEEDSIVALSRFGGTGDDFPTSIALDANGNIIVTGYTYSTDYPIVNSTYNRIPSIENSDCFITVVDANGTIVYSSLIGGDSYEFPSKIGLLQEGEIYIVGTTFSYDFPVYNCTQGGFKGGVSDMFFTIRNLTSDTIVVSRMIGGDGEDRCTDCCIDTQAIFRLYGYTDSTEVVYPLQTFETKGSLGQFDCLIVSLDRSFDVADVLRIGGSDDDFPRNIVPTGEEIIICGTTYSEDFPLTDNPYDGTLNGTNDAFILRLDSSQNNLIWSTLIGGMNMDEASEVCVDTKGQIYLGGFTRSTDFRIYGQYISMYSGLDDCFVVKFSNTLQYSVLVGGSKGDTPRAIHLSEDGCIIGVGETISEDFPVINSKNFSQTSGFDNGFLFKLGDCGDSDGDTLPDYLENEIGTDRFDNDTDGDLLSDAEEYNIYNTDPTSSDSDGDQMADHWEITNGLNPLIDDAFFDLDEDGLMNLDEYLHGTDPNLWDTDGDDISDRWEVYNGWNPLDPQVPLLEVIQYHSFPITLTSLSVATVIVLVTIRHLRREKYERLRELAETQQVLDEMKEEKQN
ncbi:MAG: hypothetical protein BAJATHORv1_90006 [Candidatus Thorarchaeota archaeon]|nr:MAG: hypothetical protein BAJATHORv1_90006 [Candidatus Thorarchaeota archaeon]